MQCVVRVGEDFVFATHEDAQDITGGYAGGPVTLPDGSSGTIPAGEIVRVPAGFAFAYDEHGLAKDPRRWAGAGSPPIASGS
jgi:hypothetical protein